MGWVGDYAGMGWHPRSPVKANWSLSSFSSTLHKLLLTTACPASGPSPLSCSFLPFRTLVIVLASYRKQHKDTQTQRQSKWYN